MSFQSGLKHEGHSFHRSLNSRAARKQENLLIDLIHFDFWGLAFQSAARYRKINQRQHKKMMMMIFLLQTTAAEEKGVCFKSSTVHLHHSFLYLQNVVLLKAGPTSLCFSGPSKTPHSWQQIIIGMKSKV